MEEDQEIHANIFHLNTLLSNSALHSSEEENITLSPFILHKFLSLLSQDQTYFYRRHFKSVLNLHSNPDRYIKCYKDFISSLYLPNHNTLSLASKLLIKDNYRLQNDFKNLTNNLNYDTEAVDFSKKDTASKLIDSWIENKTNDIVKNMSTSSLSDNTYLALLDTVHFKGKWDDTFNFELSPGTFFLNEVDSIETQMLKMKGEFNYMFDEYNSVVGLELPFASKEFSLIAILPENECGIEYYSLQYCFTQFTQNITKETVEVALPKFKIEQLTNCKNIFSDLNLNEEFADNVYLFDMLESDEFLKFSQMYEKGFISLDEEGVEAASGLTVTMVPAEFDKEVVSPDGLNMSEMAIKTTISNRFAKTLVTCRVQNKDKTAKEATFTVILPDRAFITEFVMEMNGKSYKSYIKGMEEAKAIYDEALAQGRSAGIVEADTRDSTQFNVSVNLEPESVAVFLLTYEEMLQRVHDQYELVLNICPGRVVDNINVEVSINESKPLKFVKTPPLRSGKVLNKKIEAFLIPSCDIKKINANSSVVKYSADVKQQQRISHYLGTPPSEGFTGQFVVQYDVERDPIDGEILLQDGYFVHFFAPNDLDPLPKHVVFVLDTSTSMIGRKLDQLKDAMMSILSDIRKGDLISIIEFNEDVIVWDIKSETSYVISCNEFNNFEEPFGALSELELPSPIVVDDVAISKAKNIVQSMPGQGTTFMIGGLEMALYMLKVGHEKVIDKNSRHQPIMVFLTDGQPNIGCGSTLEITQNVTKLNLRHNNVPIFSLSFGEGADKSFLRELSLKNFGFSRHIYEASDASLQLQSFYKQISSPLLTDIKFKYDSDVTEVTRSHFPIYFRGGELVVSGKCRGCQLPCGTNGCGPRGYLNLGSIVKNPVISLERLWAYLTVKQLLEERSTVNDKKELTKRAVDLALKYSFVTEVTSLVVVKPDEICDTKAPLDNIIAASGGKPKKRIIRKRCIKKQIDMSVVAKPDEICATTDPLGNFNVASNGKSKQNTCIKRIIRKMKGGVGEIVMVEEIPESCKVTEEIQAEKPKKLQFIADRPFFIAVMLKKSDKKIPLFVAWVHRPSY